MTGSVLSLTRRDDGVALLVLDDRSRPVNTLRRELVDEIEPILDELESAPPDGLVFASGKPGCFIAGADIDMFDAVADADEAQALAQLSQRVQARIERLGCPTVAAIDGSCLGGGLELALAFDRRIATDAPQTRIGLPEVQLGLLPGGGGTQRLPRLIGIVPALDLLLTGRQIDAKRARSLGIVDGIADSAELIDRAASLALSEPKRAPRRHPPRFSRNGILHWLLTGNPIGRRVVFGRARRDAHEKTRGHYPAPERIIDVLEVGFTRGFDAGLEAEARAFGALVVSAVAAELINIFHATTALKQESGVDGAVEPRAVGRLGVLGAGLMGTGIAYVSAARASVPVIVKERDADSLAAGLARLDDALAERERRGRLDAAVRREIRGRIEGAESFDAIAVCDLVIEAVFEDLELKRSLLREVERVAPEAVFASNTSALPIASIAQAAARPELVVGMHYFSPVERMPLLEVIAHSASAPEAVASAVALGKRQGKTVIVVGDGPGFYTSRILAPFLNEAAWLLADGCRISAVDAALVEFGFPVGPLKLLDEIGLDVAAKVATVLTDAFGARLAPPPGLAALQDAGHLGRKSGRGFYRYEGGGRAGGKNEDSTVYDALGTRPAGAGRSPAELAERCVLQMVNEAVRCLDEGVLRSARDGDVGAIFGLGFPPYLGGPFRYANRCGAKDVVARLEGLARRCGERFAPAPALLQRARDDERFYPERPRPRRRAPV